MQRSLLYSFVKFRVVSLAFRPLLLCAHVFFAPLYLLFIRHSSMVIYVPSRLAPCACSSYPCHVRPLTTTTAISPTSRSCSCASGAAPAAARGLPSSTAPQGHRRSPAGCLEEPPGSWRSAAGRSGRSSPCIPRRSKRKSGGKH